MDRRVSRITEPSGAAWAEYISLRDYLRSHREVAAAYANVKHALALVFVDDIAGYRNAKRPFLERVKAKALADGVR